MLGHVSFSRFDCIGAGYFALINSIAIDSNFDSIDLIDLIEVDLNFYDGIDGPVLRLGLVGPCAALCGLVRPCAAFFSVPLENHVCILHGFACDALEANSVNESINSEKESFPFRVGFGNLYSKRVELICLVPQQLLGHVTRVT